MRDKARRSGQTEENQRETLEIDMKELFIRTLVAAGWVLAYTGKSCES
jgi:hypothetical protein